MTIDKAARDEIRKDILRYAVADKDIITMLDQLDAQDAEIAELKRQLAYANSDVEHQLIGEDK